MMKVLLLVSLLCGALAFNVAPCWSARRGSVALSAEKEQAKGAETAAEEEDEVIEVEAVEEEVEGEDEEVVEEEDPNAELKEAIAKAESELKAKRLALARAKDAASNTGEAGMYRLAADIKTFKAKSDISNELVNEVAKRDVMIAFEPMLTSFEDLSVKWGDSEDEGVVKLVGNFEQSYKDIMEKLTKMGMQAFEPADGDVFDAKKHEEIEIVDDEVEVDTVVTCERAGYIVKGDVVRKAQCTVAKAAVKKDEKKQKKSRSKDADDDDDDAEEEEDEEEEDNERKAN